MGGAGTYCCCCCCLLASFSLSPPPYSYSPSLTSSPAPTASGAVGLLRCFVGTGGTGGCGDVCTLGAGGDVLPTRPAAGGDARLFDGDVLPSFAFRFEFGDTLPTLDPDPGETRPVRELGGDVRAGGRLRTVGEPEGWGMDRRVSESRRLCPYVGREVGGGLTLRWGCGC